MVASDATQMIGFTEGYVRVATGHGRFGQHVNASGHSFEIDEPREVGGDDRGPSPYDLLLASLGACTSMTCRLYAERHLIPLEGVTILLRHLRCHAADCEAAASGHPSLERIERILEFHGPLNDMQRARLLEIADRCPVHRTLTHGADIHSRLA